MPCLSKIYLGDISKIYKDQSFYKNKSKWRGNYKINNVVVFSDFEGSDYILFQRLKLDCYPYVIESRGVYEID